MPNTLTLSRVHRAGAGWYRGDFHCHTHHSDGTLTPPGLAALARSQGLDFFAITDHNTIGAYPLFEDGAGQLIIPGIEATLPEGHFNVFGLDEPGDWLDKMIDGKAWRLVRLGAHFRTTTELMQAATANGWLVSINHPLLKPWEWNDGGTDLRYVDCLEIWNDPSWPTNVEGNPRAIGLWTALLNAGYRLTGIGGSDFHTPTPASNAPAGKAAEVLGLPSTYVYAEELSGAAILSAVRARRAYVSMGPTVKFEARMNGRAYGIGEDAGEVSGAVELHAGVHPAGFAGGIFERSGGAGEQGGKGQGAGVARIVRNGETLVEMPLADGGASPAWSGKVEAGEPAWYRLEAWNERGLMLAITNPIFFGPRRAPERLYFGDFVTELNATT